MLGTATKSEQDTLIERMNAEIARLREELSRAALTITTLRGRLDEVVTQCSTTHTLTRRDVQRAVENARRTLATPSPLSDAAQEVLEAAQKECEVGDNFGLTRPGHSWMGDAGSSAYMRRRRAVDRYLALLEGRDRKEG